MVIMLWIFLNFAQVYSMCSMTQHCSQPPYQCDVPQAVSPPIPSFHENFTAPYACPTFLDQEVCCNDDQNSAMNYKFFLIGETFGHSVGGCDICAANIKLMWCHFTCNPLQSQFVSAGEQKYVPNPVSPEQKVLALLVNFTVTNSLACEIYQSCQKCPYVTQVSAMQSPQGFLEFQGYEGIPIGLAWVTFFLSDEPTSLDLQFLPCNTNVTTAYGYPVQPCTCNTCLSQCAASYYVAAPTTLEGLAWPVIGVAYLVIFVFSLIVLFSKRVWKCHQDKKKLEKTHYNSHESNGVSSHLSSY
ncbi:unnamed protein product [Blepharisma stoltei]|uniref:Niemann-Pick C1 N-terminal domain-containing protein n=1 Tax=Blepharisma stoltei TaxID=1481888 RepID=A0AAU9J499_9CILI|nr:unnamed protein product [Blepharisma stoltei]